jgi:hypothetical protein
MVATIAVRGSRNDKSATHASQQNSGSHSRGDKFGAGTAKRRRVLRSLDWISSPVYGKIPGWEPLVFRFPLAQVRLTAN